MTNNSFEDLWQKCWKKKNRCVSRLLCFPFALYRAYSKERLPEDAQSMVYITLLTLVPLLAVAFALLRGFGVENIIEPWLRNILAPMGDAGEQVAGQLINFVNQAKANSLGTIGVIFLFFSVMKLAQKMETTLNRIWQIDNNRHIKDRIAGYISSVLLAPLLIGSIMSTVLGIKKAAWLQPYLENPTINLFISFITHLIPMLLIFLIISAIYYAIPNRKVKWYAAAAGAAFFLILWFPISLIFSHFIARSQSYSVIYSSFASIIILLFWLYFLWLIFIFGAKFASLIQNPYLLAPDSDYIWYSDEQLQLSSAIINISIVHFQKNQTAPCMQDFFNALPAQPFKIITMVDKLKEAQLICETTDEPPKYMPSKAVSLYTLGDLHRAMAIPDDRYDAFAPKMKEIRATMQPILEEKIIKDSVQID